jgi:hypothetical protein
MRTAIRLLAASALAGAGIIAATGTASATPANCSVTHPTTNSVAGKCTSGTGTYHIHADCFTVKPGDIIEFELDGPTVTIGQQSKVTCGNRPPDGGIQFG